MAEISGTMPMQQAPAATPRHAALAALTDTSAEGWRALAARTIEPNGYYLADWELAVNATSPGRTDARALAAFSDTRLIGLLPVIPFQSAFRLPLPALVNADGYGTLSTPLLDSDDAARGLLAAARASGARALVLFNMSLDGRAMAALRAALAEDGLAPKIITRHERASLDATRDADTVLRDGLGAKKVKELRRLRNRLAEHGEVRFDIARTPDAVAAALADFLVLEASGWKGQRGTALNQTPGDDAFIRRATVALAAQGACEIATLRAGEAPVAAGILLRHLGRAYYFKIGIDERFAKYSPGVQLTLDVTRHLCADPAIASADSTAAPGHPMIDPIWRERLAIGDVVLPLRRNDPVANLIFAGLTLRHRAREGAKRLLHRLRKR